MDMTLFTILRNAISFLPAAWVCVLPVKDHLCFSKKKIYICTIILNIILAFSVTIISELLVISDNSVLFAMLIPMFCIYYFCCRVHPPILIFIFATSMLLMAFVSSSIDGICLEFFPDSENFYFIYLEVLVAVILIFLSPIMYIFVKRITKVAFAYNNRTVWRVLWIIPITFTAILVLYPAYTPLQYLYASIILIIGSIIVYHAIFIMMEQSILAVKLQEENRVKENLLLIEQSQYNTLFSSIEQARIASHDLRHHFNAIMAYSKSNQPDKVQTYIEQYLSNQPEDNLNVYCENPAVNKLLSYYQSLAKKQGIDTDFAITMSASIAITEPDLWVLFGNCLENAIEACCRYEDSPKFIKLTAKQQGVMLGITIDNSYKGEIFKAKANLFLSSKATSRTGIGLQSVQAIVDKYHGMLEIKHDNNLFCVSIMLCLSTDIEDANSR